MVLIMSNYILALVFAVVSVDGSVGGLQGELSEKELLGLADMYHHSKAISKRSLRNTGDMDDHRYHKRHMFPDYKHCCGETDSRNNIRRKEAWTVVKDCVEQVKTKSNELEEFVNPITDEFSCERLKQEKNRHYCIADCVLKNTEALKDGTVNRDKAKEFFTKGISAEWLKEIAENAVEKCAEQKVFTSNGEQLDCSPQAVNLKHCFWKEMILTCPKEHFKKSPYCSRVKEAFEEMEN
ncbi:uncharacterized protein [Halyomorpha halys]|uniref:uncharacterized protein n=1 Tax=Halyomorpha halys TaxID=286706 RepID=UPI0006D50A73|nr:uncharacterized protein LOC106683908 [Halyomorpha halys]KAE8573942.1 Odorant-binding protein 29 [Halyomorpha halys]